MRYRICKVTKGDMVWFTAERSYLFFFWTNCVYGRKKFNTVDDAKSAIEAHKRIMLRPKKELVIKL